MLHQLIALLIVSNPSLGAIPTDKREIAQLRNHFNDEQEGLLGSTETIAEVGPRCEAVYFFTSIGPKAAKALAEKKEGTDGVERDSLETIRHRRESVQEAVNAMLSNPNASAAATLSREEKSMREILEDGVAKKNSLFGKSALNTVREKTDDPNCVELIRAIDNADRHTRSALSALGKIRRLAAQSVADST